MLAFIDLFPGSPAQFFYNPLFAAFICAARFDAVLTGFLLTFIPYLLLRAKLRTTLGAYRWPLLFVSHFFMTFIALCARAIIFPEVFNALAFLELAFIVVLWLWIFAALFIGIGTIWKRIADRAQSNHNKIP